MRAFSGVEGPRKHGRSGQRRQITYRQQSVYAMFTLIVRGVFCRVFNAVQCFLAPDIGSMKTCDSESGLASREFFFV